MLFSSFLGCYHYKEIINHEIKPHIKMIHVHVLTMASAARLDMKMRDGSNLVMTNVCMRSWKCCAREYSHMIVTWHSVTCCNWSHACSVWSCDRKCLSCLSFSFTDEAVGVPPLTTGSASFLLLSLEGVASWLKIGGRRLIKIKIIIIYMYN